MLLSHHASSWLLHKQLTLNVTCLSAFPQFTLDCRPFYVAGFNVDNIAQAAVAAVARKAGTAG